MSSRTVSGTSTVLDVRCDFRERRPERSERGASDSTGVDPGRLEFDSETTSSFHGHWEVTPNCDLRRPDVELRQFPGVCSGRLRSANQNKPNNLPLVFDDGRPCAPVQTNTWEGTGTPSATTHQ